MQEVEKIPVTILTGFLGSGKTTLLNWILRKNHGKKIAVIENEFGEVGIDGALVASNIDTEETVVVMNNGCICCTVRGDLIKAFHALAESKTKLDAVVIETTGLADPAPVCQTFFMDPVVEKVAYLDAVVTVVDAKHVIQHLDEVKPDGVENEAVEQIAFADRIVLNKIDLVDAQNLATIESRLKSLNGVAKHIKAQLSSECIPLEEILGLRSFSLDRVLEFDPEFLKDQEHMHDQSVSSIGLVFEGDIALSHMYMWLQHFLRTYGTDLFRYKGVLAIKGKEQKFVFQGIHMLFDGEFTAPWKAEEKRENRMTFIGKNLPWDEIKKNFMACVVTEELRFKVGDSVECAVEEGFTKGAVLRLWDDGNPYRVRLVTGVEVWAPIDEDEFIRAIPQ